MDPSQQQWYDLYSRIQHEPKVVMKEFFIIAVYISVMVYLVVKYRQEMGTKPTDEEEYCEHHDQHYKRFHRQGEKEPETQAFASSVDVPRHYEDAV
ncbi:hypothetical protein THARTR1_07430 [Trichoderma harzianum]|uniref:Uncharacterized protein n=1 Tax=Trichoderma harzianum TaxID=5544 RepID=A0A2K0U366_TRIHA|nr:hypothetical protein THARTR1_07430 [Trichoderma harzianum]